MQVPRAVRLIAPPALSVAAIVALVVALAPYRHGIGHALDRSTPGEFVALTVLSLAALALRTEVWRAGLAAADQHPPRRDLHAANGGTFTAALASHLFAPGVKMWLLRRMQGDRATHLLELVAIDVATLTLEVLLAAALVIYAAFSSSLRWWVPALMVVAGLGALAVAALARRHRPDHPAVRGLRVLSHSPQRTQLLAAMAVVFAVQIARGWIALHAVGLHPDAKDAVLVFVATGVLGALPTGITAAPTAATLLVAGSRGTGAAAGAGVLLTATLVAGTLIYAAAAALAYRAGRSATLTA